MKNKLSSFFYPGQALSLMMIQSHLSLPLIADYITSKYSDTGIQSSALECFSGLISRMHLQQVERESNLQLCHFSGLDECMELEEVVAGHWSREDPVSNRGLVGIGVNLRTMNFQCFVTSEGTS